MKAVPRSRRQVYKMRPIVEAVVDRGSFFEMGAHFGRSIIGGLARLQGIPVLLLASDPYAIISAVNALRATRGGALSASSFGIRMTGTGPAADLLAQRFRMACGKLGLGHRGPALDRFDTSRFRPPAGTNDAQQHGCGTETDRLQRTDPHPRHSPRQPLQSA